MFVQFALFLFIGIELACFFGQHPLPRNAELKPDEVFAHFIVNHYPRNTGLIGLMLAAILASNLSSSLSASAAAVVNDFYLPVAEDAARVAASSCWLTRVLTVVFGVVQIALGILAERLVDRGRDRGRCGADDRRLCVWAAAGRVRPGRVHAPRRTGRRTGGHGEWACVFCYSCSSACRCSLRRTELPTGVRTSPFPGWR